MKQLGILGSALLALFALGVVMTNPASAEEGVLPAEAFTGKSGAVTHTNLNKEEIKCTSSEGSGKFLTEKEKDQHGTGTITLKGCTALGFAANTLGDPAGTIKTAGLFLICLINSATLLFGVLAEPTETVHGEVPALKALLLLKGAIIGSLTKAGELEGTTFEGVFNEKDETSRTKCTIEGKALTSTFEASLDTKADVDTFETGTGTITFAKTIKFEDK